MSDNPSNRQNPSDEIDLGQLLAMIRNGVNSLFKGLLKIFLYLKRNAVMLFSLVVVGALIGYGLTFIVIEEQKLDIIVTPNLDTKNYLYNAIAEIQSDIEAKDTVFFNSLGMDIDKMKDFEIEINPIKQQKSSPEGEMKLLEILKDFENNEAIADILRAELRDQSIKDERITIFFKDDKIGEDYAQKIMSYINSNPYYNELVKVYTENANNRIAQNDSLIKQVDNLINNYTNKMLKEQATTEGRLVLENQEPLNVPSLLTLKNTLIQDTESKKLELERRKEAITIVNFGKPHKVEKPFLAEKVALVPLIFVSIFFIISIIRYLNKKSKELQTG